MAIGAETYDLPERPRDATHRIIIGIYLDLAKLPGDDTRHRIGLFVNLDRRGMPLKPIRHGNGLPRPPVRRTIDLRVGDEVRFWREWRVVTGIHSRSYWLNDEQAANVPAEGDGYVYRLTDSAAAESNARRRMPQPPLR